MESFHVESGFIHSLHHFLYTYCTHIHIHTCCTLLYTQCLLYIHTYSNNTVQYSMSGKRVFFSFCNWSAGMTQNVLLYSYHKSYVHKNCVVPSNSKLSNACPLDIENRSTLSTVLNFLTIHCTMNYKHSNRITKYKLSFVYSSRTIRMISRYFLFL